MWLTEPPAVCHTDGGRVKPAWGCGVRMRPRWVMLTHTNERRSPVPQQAPWTGNMVGNATLRFALGRLLVTSASPMSLWSQVSLLLETLNLGRIIHL